MCEPNPACQRFKLSPTDSHARRAGRRHIETHPAFWSDRSLSSYTSRVFADNDVRFWMIFGMNTAKCNQDPNGQVMSCGSDGLDPDTWGRPGNRGWASELARLRRSPGHCGPDAKWTGQPSCLDHQRTSRIALEVVFVLATHRLDPLRSPSPSTGIAPRFARRIRFTDSVVPTAPKKGCW